MLLWNAAPTFVISVRDCRCRVAKRVDYPSGFSYVAALNWEELEEEAAQAVEDAGGAVNWSGLYPCPDRLAQQGRWEESQT